MRTPTDSSVIVANKLGSRIKYVALSPNDPIEFGDVLIWKSRGGVIGAHVNGTTEATIKDIAPDVSEVVRPMPLSDDENAFLKQELAWAIDNYDFLRQELAWVMDNYVPATEDIHALADHKTKIAQLLKEVR